MEGRRDNREKYMTIPQITFTSPKTTRNLRKFTNSSVEYDCNNFNLNDNIEKKHLNIHENESINLSKRQSIMESRERC
jgi:hypothetical protein